MPTEFVVKFRQECYGPFPTSVAAREWATDKFYNYEVLELRPPA